MKEDYEHGFRVRFNGNKTKVKKIHKLLKKFCKDNELNLGFYSQTGQVIKKKKKKVVEEKKGFFRRK